MDDVALATTVFMRHDKLSNMLNSVPEWINKVYVADDSGKEIEDVSVYAKEYPFELEVFDLEFDSGLGFGRSHIVENSTEPYILIADADMEVPKSVEILHKQLQEDSSIGGVCGTLAEESRLYSSTSNLFEENGSIIKDIRSEPDNEKVAGYPFFEFDFIANAAMFRRECLEDYSWDPNIVIGREHIDFYIGHYRSTNWRFGLSPSVTFFHQPGGDSDFTTERHHSGKTEEAERYVLNKWGYNSFQRKQEHYIDSWDETYGMIPQPPLTTRIHSKYRREGASALVKRAFEKLRGGI